jgi:DNA polymerase-1
MEKRILVIDGNSLMHRAFYGVPPLSNRAGEPTNAVYGFLNMLLRILKEYEPQWIGIAFDTHAPTFRHEAYADYKGTRHKTPEDLIPQFHVLREVLPYMGIAVMELDGYEADDILGTCAREAEDKGVDAYLVTGDKDALQLVSDTTRVVLTKRGITDIHLYDPKALREEYGLAPGQIVDMKALMGDSSDNIPGVPGVGKKTALSLLADYKDIEGIYAHVEEIKGKLKDKLTDNEKLARLSRELAEIDTHVPVGDVFTLCARKPMDHEKLLAALNHLELHSIIDKLGLDTDNAAICAEAETQTECTAVHTAEELAACMKSLSNAKHLGILEGDLISLAAGTERVWQVVPEETLLLEGPTREEIYGALTPLIENPGCEKIVYGAKRWYRYLWEQGIEPAGPVQDVRVAAYLCDVSAGRYDIPRLAYQYFGRKIEEGDAAELIRLWDKLRAALKEQGMEALYQKVEAPLIPILARMERTGFMVDTGVLKDLDKQFAGRLDELTASVYAQAGHDFNIQSTKQLGVVLFEELGLPVVKRTKTGYSTDIEVLENLSGSHPIIDMLIEYRQIAKLKSTYIDGLLDKIDPKDKRIHTRFSQTGTATGRLSSNDPNLQNIPVRQELGRQIRQAFVAADDDHILVDADYSQIELRVLAHISEDPAFIRAFTEGEDIHARTASEIFDTPMEDVTFEMRRQAKAVNFGIVYGISDYGLARNLGIPRAQAQNYIDQYFVRYPGIKAYMDRAVREGKESGYVTTLLGRRRPIPELKSRNYNLRSFGERAAMNTPIQGSAADIIKLAMIAVAHAIDKMDLKSKLILQVHDELIVDAAREETDIVIGILKEQMEHVIELRVPLIADISTGRSWFAAK